MCAPCHAAGKRRKLAEFDLGPDGPSQTSYTRDGAWSGPDGDDKVHLRCACGHDRQIRRDRIMQALAAITGKSTIYL